MGERCCRYCHKPFQPSKFQPRQSVCGELICQRRRRTEYHRQKIANDPEYREVCRDSPRKWRVRNSNYWKQYRAAHPDAVARNRQQQELRDHRERLRHLANNTSALDLKHSAAEVWLVGAGAEVLLRNTRCGLMHSGLLSLGHHCEPEGLSLCSEPRFGASTKVALISPENRFIVSLTRG